MTNAAAAFDAHANDYNAARRRLIPPFDRFYGTAVEGLGLAPQPPRRVLDLGAGTGLLASFVRQAYPDAHLTLLDGAGRMLAQARETLGDDNVAYVEGDMAGPWPDGAWDAIVSGLAIHHLDDEGKRGLMRRVANVLTEGGVFVNAEQVAGPSARLDAAYASWHEASARAAGASAEEWSGAVTRMAHDRCATVEDQLGWLREAGFRQADCLFKDHRFAVMVALR